MSIVAPSTRNRVATLLPDQADLVPQWPLERWRALPDAELVPLARGGDHDAFDTLYARYSERIFNYLARLLPVGAQVDAADLTQDCFLKAFVALPRTRDDVALKVRPWLYRIATNCLLDQLRRERLVRWLPLATVFPGANVTGNTQAEDGRSAADGSLNADGKATYAGSLWRSHGQVIIEQGHDANPEAALLDAERAAQVQRILDQLYPQHRTVLLLREFTGLSYDEMAGALHITRAAVKSLLFRARCEFRVMHQRLVAKGERSLTVELGLEEEVGAA